MQDLDDFTRGYLECALWSSTDSAEKALDERYDVTDFNEYALQKIIQDCKAFQENNSVPLSVCGQSLAYSGHDYWLTRNHHGAGFWDRDAKTPEQEEAFELLHKASKKAGESAIYEGDDGKLYI